MTESIGQPETGDAQPACHPERSEGSGRDVRERSVYADDLYCPECGYSLRGLTSDRCPECGLDLGFIESETSLIPWERRRELGHLRAYWQTVFQVMFRNKVFCRAVYRPVSYRDAQSFRWVSILHVYIPMLLTLPAVHLRHPHLLPLAADETGVWFIVLVCVCFLLALLAFTGVPSYLFHPRFLSIAQQNRATAISYYGSASLALMPVAVVGFCTAIALSRVDSALVTLFGLAALFLLVFVLTGHIVLVRFRWRVPLFPPAWAAVLPLVLIILCGVWVAIGESPREIEYVLAAPFALVPLGILALCWFDLISIARQTLRRGFATIRVALLVPLLWIVAGGLVLIGLPAVAYCLALVFYSLRSSGLGGW